MALLALALVTCVRECGMMCLGHGPKMFRPSMVLSVVCFPEGFWVPVRCGSPRNILDDVCLGKLILKQASQELAFVRISKAKTMACWLPVRFVVC